ncbi:hypothetical protein [Bradyrhizobium sp. RDM4]|jgi:hypothetical protein
MMERITAPSIARLGGMERVVGKLFLAIMLIGLAVLIGAAAYIIAL